MHAALSTFFSTLGNLEPNETKNGEETEWEGQGSGSGVVFAMASAPANADVPPVCSSK